MVSKVFKTNFEPTKISRRQNGDVMEIPCGGTTNIGRRRKNFVASATWREKRRNRRRKSCPSAILRKSCPSATLRKSCAIATLRNSCPSATLRTSCAIATFKVLCRCHFIDQNYRVSWPGIEPEPPR